jgi:hypothetical protein
MHRRLTGRQSLAAGSTNSLAICSSCTIISRSDRDLSNANNTTSSTPGVAIALQVVSLDRIDQCQGPALP